MYKLIFHWSDGTTDEDDNFGEFYETEEEADYAGQEGLSDARFGGEIFEMSNPGDYPFDPSNYDDDTYEIVEV